MPVTSPDSIYYADGSTPMSAEDISAAEATSVQAAFTNKITNKRQIQTFVWANTAARTAQTGMIAGDFGYQTDTGVTYRYSGTVWVAFYPGGIVGVIPTSVAGSGVSYSTTTGLVTFTSATTITVNGCFTSAYRGYSIAFESTGTASNCTMVLRAAGTDSITGYDKTELLGRNAIASSSTSLNSAAWTVQGLTNTIQMWDLNINNPALAVATSATSVGGAHGNPAASSAINGIITNILTHRPLTAYDGFTLTLSAAQSGTVRVLGRN